MGSTRPWWPAWLFGSEMPTKYAAWKGGQKYISGSVILRVHSVPASVRLRCSLVQTGQGNLTLLANQGKVTDRPMPACHANRSLLQASGNKVSLFLRESLQELFCGARTWMDAALIASGCHLRTPRISGLNANFWLADGRGRKKVGAD